MEPNKNTSITNSNEKEPLIPIVHIKNITDTRGFHNIPESFLIYNERETQDVKKGYYYWNQGQWNLLILDINTINSAHTETTNTTEKKRFQASVTDPEPKDHLSAEEELIDNIPVFNNRMANYKEREVPAKLQLPPSIFTNSFVADINGQNWSPSPPRWYVETDKRIKISGNGTKEHPHTIGITPKSITASDIAPLYDDWNNRNIYTLVCYRGNVQWQQTNYTSTDVYTLD